MSHFGAAYKGYKIAKTLLSDASRLRQAFGDGHGENSRTRNTGVITQSQHKTYAHSIPRNVWQDVVGEPRYSKLWNGRDGATSLPNRMGVDHVEMLQAWDLNTFMREMRLFYQNNETVGPPQNTPALDEAKLLGCLFRAEQELIITNWSNVPARLWIVEYSYKKNGSTFGFGDATPQLNLEFEELWSAGTYLDTDNQSEAEYNMYGNSYGRSDPLRAYLRIESSKEVHMAPGQNHIHKSTYNLNKLINMQEIVTRTSYNDSVPANYKLAGITRGIALIWHGFPVTAENSADPMLSPIELAWIWRRSLNGVLQDRIYGKTKFTQMLGKDFVPADVVVPQTGVITAVADLIGP